MRVLILASDRGSLTNFRGDLIREIGRRASAVYVAAPDLNRDSAEAPELESLGAVPLAIHHMRRNSVALAADLSTLLELRRLFKDTKPDLVLAYTAKPVIYGLLAARLAGVRGRVALITGLGYSFIDAGRGRFKRRLIGKIVRILYRFSLSGATKVLFQNPDDRDIFVSERIIASSTPTFVVNGSGVNLQRFAPRPIPRAATCFLMVGRILRDKGVAEFISAAAMLKREFPDVEVILAGPFDSNPGAITKDELQVLLSGSGVRYIGSLADVRDVLAACHVFVLPSYREGTPRTVLEAMAVGRPIITTDVPGCRETVREGFNGYLVPERSADRLLEAMRRFMDDPSLVEVMGRNSLQMARDKYDVEKVNATVLREIGF